MPTAIIAIIIAYCSVQYMTGDKGFLSQKARNEDIAAKQVALVKLKIQRQDLETPRSVFAH